MIAAHDGAIATMMAGRAAAPGHGACNGTCRAAAASTRSRRTASTTATNGCTSTSTAAGSSGAAASSAPRWRSALRSGWPPGCGRSTTGCRPTTPSRPRLDDCLAAYRALLGERSPERIVIGGASAGGNLAAALILRARDEGLPLPAAVVLMTPGPDLTEAGDSHQTNLGLDPLIPGSGRQSFLLYAAGQDLRHPYLSPLNGDFTKGFPPAILTTGTRDMLLSDTVLLHRALRRAGIPAELHVTEAGRARRVPRPGAGRPGDPGRGPALRRHPLGLLTDHNQKSTPVISNGPWLPSIPPAHLYPGVTLTPRPPATRVTFTP